MENNKPIPPAEDPGEEATWRAGSHKRAPKQWVESELPFRLRPKDAPAPMQINQETPRSRESDPDGILKPFDKPQPPNK